MADSDGVVGRMTLNRLPPSVTLKFEIVTSRQWRWRVRLAGWLFRLGARVLGGSAEVIYGRTESHS